MKKKFTNAPVVLLTGASSGIGFETAKRLSAEGCKVYGAARRVERMEPLKAFGVVPVRMDVTDEKSLSEGVESILQAEGRIDVLINNAGYGSLGAIENVPLAHARSQMEVNLFGAARLVQLVLPHMRAQGGGTIVNVTSIAGKVPFFLYGWYNISKFGLEAFSDALRTETKAFGIKVVMIEPGAILTEWGGIAADNLAAASRGTAYEEQALNHAETLRKIYSMKFLSPPSVIARKVSRALRSRHPRARYRAGMGSTAIVFLHAILPARWWDAVVRLGGKKYF